MRSRAETLELHNGLVGSSFEVVADTGHMVPMEAPQRLATIIREWLAQQKAEA
ncbi:alpha/beta fold hydrolase [Ensifer sp. ENS06]|uniref:alpha/beta fold hydrolase n=1 Tax=Ensifer sp. ENS06 TaxID=2769276 RepID=UPI001AEE4F93|nr:hypothetical protein [Ensifer sp. ENS06]